MSKDIVAAVEEYIDREGNTKKKWVNIGVIMSNENGEYVLLDPTVNLAGIMMKQRIMNPQKAGKTVIASVFYRDTQRTEQQQATPQQDELDSSIPF